MSNCSDAICRFSPGIDSLMAMDWYSAIDPEAGSLTDPLDHSGRVSSVMVWMNFKSQMAREAASAAKMVCLWPRQIPCLELDRFAGAARRQF